MSLIHVQSARRPVQRRARLLSMLRHDKGASAVEYALLIAGIAAVIIVAVTFVGRTVSGQFSKVGSSIASTN
jgi:pilus assembly protein Flp/PilA